MIDLKKIYTHNKLSAAKKSELLGMGFSGTRENMYLAAAAIKRLHYGRISIYQYFDAKIFKEIGIKPPTAAAKKYFYTTRTEYQNKSARWGAYNPCTYLSVYYQCEINGVQIAVKEYDELLGHGQAIPFCNSKLIKEVKKELAGGFSIVEKKLIYKRKILDQINIISRAGTSYHYNKSKTATAAKKLLNEKISKKNAAARQSAKDKKELGRIISKKEVIDLFGFCEIGINDFINSIGLKDKSLRIKTILNAWKKCEEKTKERLNKEYREEILTVIKYLKKL